MNEQKHMMLELQYHLIQQNQIVLVVHIYKQVNVQIDEHGIKHHINTNLVLNLVDVDEVEVDDDEVDEVDEVEVDDDEVDEYLHDVL